MSRNSYFFLTNLFFILQFRVYSSQFYAGMRIKVRIVRKNCNYFFIFLFLSRNELSDPYREIQLKSLTKDSSICIIINYYDDDDDDVLSRKRCAFVRLKYTIQCYNSFIIDI